MPVIAGESSYDGLDFRAWGGGVLSSDALRQMFWVGLMHNGVAGGTYGANGIWSQPPGQTLRAIAARTKLGSISWDEAMNRAGSTQVGLAKQFFSRYPWQNLEPCPAADSLGRQRARQGRHPALCLCGRDELLIVYVPFLARSL